MRLTPITAHLLRITLVCVVWSAAAEPVSAQSLPAPEVTRSERLSVELGLHGAGVLNHSLDADARGGGRFTLRLLWPLGSRVRLGLRVGLLMTSMSYGEQDERLWMGIRPVDPDLPFANHVVTLIPSVSFLFQVRLWRWLELDATVGLAAPMAVWRSGDQASQVSPTFGLGLLFYVYRHRRAHVALRVGFDAVPLVSHPRQPWLFLPLGGVLVRFPIYHNPPTLNKNDVPGPFG